MTVRTATISTPRRGSGPSACGAALAEQFGGALGAQPLAPGRARAPRRVRGRGTRCPVRSRRRRRWRARRRRRRWCGWWVRRSCLERYPDAAPEDEPVRVRSPSAEPPGHRPTSRPASGPVTRRRSGRGRADLRAVEGPVGEQQLQQQPVDQRDQRPRRGRVGGVPAEQPRPCRRSRRRPAAGAGGRRSAARYSSYSSRMPPARRPRRTPPAAGVSASASGASPSSSSLQLSMRGLRLAVDLLQRGDQQIVQAREVVRGGAERHIRLGRDRAVAERRRCPSAPRP